MIQWLKLSDERKTQLLNQAAVETRFLAHAIEKDWWVTLALQAIFATKWQNNLVFKGGTSLSKAWGLVERLSEDVDLALDRKVLGFPETFVSNAQIRKLRRKASEFIGSEFLPGLERTLIEMGISADQFELSLQETEIEEKDPQVIELGYHSALEPDAYITDWVLIEIGARSLREPSSGREIKTILGKSLEFTELMARLLELKQRFRKMQYPLPAA